MGGPRNCAMVSISSSPTSVGLSFPHERRGLVPLALVQQLLARGSGALVLDARASSGVEVTILLYYYLMIFRYYY